MTCTNEIEELAELVASEHWQQGRVNPCDIASALGLTFSFARYDDYFDGLIECKARRFHVYINLDTNKTADSSRARFSFAHELGHYFIDWHRHALEHGAPSHGSMVDFESAMEIEREADLFAANLLMPRERLRAAARPCIEAAEIRRLASAFGTSLSATAIRCAQMNLGPMIVMKWIDSGRSWCWSSPQFEKLTGNKAFRAIERIIPGSITRQVLNGNLKIDLSTYTKGTTLAAWFPFVKSGSAADEIMVEECISLGPHGVLTILRPAMG